ncbi:sigma-E factor negative regulatory protein [Aquabacterium sp.]|uniref:sigma-E factor negative regulatory protein n=1 Tax=Aquabacterium TaxID=92793 RepID=UPI001D679315|nr:sigma-E factor negative regulatory protein [Aquabacterium sp.]MBT9611482.1 sigma-E factor negative regulatory protein [Aquabacterium sp.]|tara:strand:- start:1377 stop:2072 length:696 start_codon:yes stop_codon:yes gene_type:complete
MSEILSALSDGQATPEEVARASAAWRDDPQARASWHRYQLIGDALRSPELLQASEGSAFLQGFRARLAQEPVVLAPQAAHAARTEPHSPASALQEAQLKRRPWAGPAAVAASFVLLVGLMASNLSGVGQDVSARTDTLSSAQSAAWGVQDMRVGNSLGLVASSFNAPSSTRLQAAHAMGASFDSTDQTEGVLIRDPRVEPLLSLQRPMVIDPPAATFSEPGLSHTVGYTAP